MKHVLIYFMFFLIVSANAQRVVIPAAHSDYRITYQKHRGYIQLNNGKKIMGIFQYAFWEFPTPNIKSFNEKGNLINRYQEKEIKSIVLAGADSTLSAKDSTYFKTLDKSKSLYRQLTFGPLEIYDYFFNVNEVHGLIYSLILVKVDNQLYTFKSYNKFISWIHANYKDKIKWKKDITVKDIIRQLNGFPT